MRDQDNSSLVRWAASLACVALVGSAACAKSCSNAEVNATAGAATGAAPVEPVPTPVSEPEPAAEPVAEAEEGAEDTSIKAALLGLNRKDEVVEEPAEPEPPKRRVRRTPRRATNAASNDAVAVAPIKPTLSDAQFQDAVNGWRGLRTCLTQSSLRGRDRSGALKMAFRIRGDGSVASSKVTEMSNAVARTIAPCVEQSARRIRFPAYGGDDVDKEAKFVF